MPDPGEKRNITTLELLRCLALSGSIQECLSVVVVVWGNIIFPDIDFSDFFFQFMSNA